MPKEHSLPEDFEIGQKVQHVCNVYGDSEHFKTDEICEITGICYDEAMGGLFLYVKHKDCNWLPDICEAHGDQGTHTGCGGWLPKRFKIVEISMSIGSSSANLDRFMDIVTK